MVSYLTLHQRSQLKEIRDSLLERIKRCDLCPRKCGVNRLREEKGFCHTGRRARVSSFFLHFGEERELVGRGGSGTIFFSYCNLGCIYCQNYAISHRGEGQEVEAEELATMMMLLQRQGAHNINFVTPTHVLAQIIEALILAVEQGLTLPLVYNCGGYENKEVLKEIRGVFDIYMPDIKYMDEVLSYKLSGVKDYPSVVKEAVLEMYNQVGDLIIEDGIAKRGLLIRHLVLPNQRVDSFRIIDFIRDNLSSYTYINIMNQYYPCYRAYEFVPLRQRLTYKEYQDVLNYAYKKGLKRGFK